MKTISKFASYLLIVAITSSASCKKDKKTVTAADPPANNNETEVVTTLKVYFWDSISNAALAGSPFTFKDADGGGGQAGAFLNNGLDSVINLAANKVYKTQVVILDETKNPADSISNVVAGEESFEHMLFYNGNPANATNNNGNSIVKSGYPNYTVKLNGSNIIMRYADTDNGAGKGKIARNIGLQTYVRTQSAVTGKFPFIVTLRHQPEGAKDGTYAPGESDVEVAFKVSVN
ncbi:MAG: hypothetical protein IT236_00960 [Bacteroidia bacterium]|nr:hypothetical protein [Bacteroidia bacterium]